MYHPATNEPALEWIELHNQMSVDVDISGWSIAKGIDYTFPNGAIIKSGGYLVVAISPGTLSALTGVTNVFAPFTGRLSNAGEKLELRDLNNRLMNEVNYGTDGDWPVGADGAGVSLAKKHPNLASKPAENWTVSAQVGGTPGTANFPVAAGSVVIVTTNSTLVSFGASWRYYQSGDPGAGWSTPGFNDSAWGVGPALLGFETNTLPLPLLTTLTLGETAYYFRTTFQFSGNPAGAALRLQHVVDDGLVVYLNGIEVLRTGMAEGPVTHATLTSRGVSDAVVEGPFLIPSASLVSGRNVLALEVHQTAATSSDVVFGLRLDEQRTLGTVTNASGVAPLTGATTNVVPLAATWRFNDSGVDLGSAWRHLAYDDSAWGSGPALFFVEDAPLPGPKNTPLTPGRNTYYFRTIFPFDGDPAMKLLSFRAVLEDGAVIYLNGAEIGRVNMPAGAVTYSTMALTTVPNAAFTGLFSIASSNLVVGQNVLAVELHQTTAQTNAGLRISRAAAYAVTWDGSDGDFFSSGSPALAPTNAALASLGVDVFASSNTNLAANLNDGRYGSSSAWSPAANDPSPSVILRFNQPLAISSIAWSRDNGDTDESACGGTCTDRALGNYTFQYTLATNPATVTTNSSNPSNGWTTVATVQYLSAQPGFTPHLRHRFDFAATNGNPILATGIRLRPAVSNTIDEIEINPPAVTNFGAVFGMELTSTDILPPPPRLAFNEVSAASSSAFWLEIINCGDAPAELSGVTVLRTGGGSPACAFPAQALPPGGIVSLTQAQLGFSAADGQKLFLYTPGRFLLLDAVTVRASSRGRHPDGNGDWRYPALPTPGASNVFAFHDEIVFNEIMYHHRPFDPIPAVTSNLTVVGSTGPWRYNDSGADLGTAWRAPGYDDSAWPSGAGLMAFNTATLPAPVNTVLAPGPTTYYFRATFSFSGATSNLSLNLRSVVDDGAVFYLNGAEIYRQNMPLGSVVYSTSATGPVGDAGYVGPVTLPASNLVQGVNVLAVEVHQVTPATTSSGVVLSGGGLTLVEEGPFGGTPPMNLARQPGVTPFVIDSLAGYPIHDYLHLNDGVHGNANSWIGNSGNPGYAGLRFGALYTISSIAFGRDNLGTYSDRTLGLYTLQYTRVASPGTAMTVTGNPDTDWATIGTLNYQSAGTGLFANPSRRHRFTFTPVEATGLRLLVPSTGLSAGTCIDELEVNPPDTSGDVAFGAELVLTATLAVPFTKSSEEWVEFYNRSTNTVDLSGWRLDGAIDYRFQTGTVVQADGYLVVANDAVALRAKWPAVAANILGDFTGRMSEGEKVGLKDSSGNVVNAIRVRAHGWSDGGGSSLEMTDPRADNSHPAAWADSDESTRSAWQTVTYRMVAGQRYGSSFWHEFRLGMLDAGEVLVDDVSVIRDPDGTRQQLIQNSDFEITTGNTHWRMLGNHGRSQIITDSDNPANHVLKVSATGPARTSHNHIESSFVNNTPLVDGHQYEVSFRARWLAGSPQLGTTAYFQKLARTTLLPLPPRHGTPGAVNSRRVANAGPTFTGLKHAPVIPAANQPVTISVRAGDPDGVASATLDYRVNPATEFTSIPMALQSNGTWTASIPGQTAGKIVQFYVSAQDSLGATVCAPPKGPDSRALYQVADAQGANLPAHELRLTQLDAERDFLLQATNVMRQERLGATVIYDRSEVFYDAGVRLQGSAAGRARDGDQYISYDIAFPPDHRFRGVLRNVGIDRSGRAPVVRQQDEIYILHMFQRAGLPCHRPDLCYFIAPKTLHTGTAILQLSTYDALFVDEQYNADGSIFNFDVTYEPSVTVNGNFEAPKLPVPLQPHIGTDFADLGNDKEQYRSPFSIRHGERADDFTGIIRLCQTMGLPQAQFDAPIAAALDVNEALRLTALTILCGIGDIYFSATPSLPHNSRIFTPADGGPAQFLPWDMDFVFLADAGGSIFPTTTANISKFLNNPTTRRLYLWHVYDLCQSVFNTSYMNPWLAHYGSVVGQNYASASTYIQNRRNSALSQLPAAQPFAITSNGGNDFLTNTPAVTISGRGWLDIREIRLAGTTNPLDVTWTTVTNWQATVPLLFGANLLTFVAYDRQTNQLAAASITITCTVVGGGQDADGDGLPDAWEIAHGLNPVANDADADTDGDGLTNWQEYITGTNPNDARRFLALHATNERGTVRLEFYAMAGRTYSILSSDELQSAPWTTLTNVPAQPTDRIVTLTAPFEPPQQFFRLVTPPRP